MDGSVWSIEVLFWDENLVRSYYIPIWSVSLSFISILWFSLVFLFFFVFWSQEQLEHTL